jgi:hypothetical protein
VKLLKPRFGLSIQSLKMGTQNQETTVIPSSHLPTFSLSRFPNLRISAWKT